MKKYITKSFKETQKLGEKLALQLCSGQAQAILNCKKNNSAENSRSYDFCTVEKNTNNAIVLCLYGDLGGGKTTFLQGFAKGLGVKEKILSPTFVIMKRFSNFYHIDSYRLKNYKDAKELDLEDIFKNPENIVAIEWPEKIKKILPKSCIKIKFKFVSENERELTIG